MNMVLSPVAPRCLVADADDPFKKYWWVILLGNAFTALWLISPFLGERSIGSNAVDLSKPKADANVEQSLASGAGDGVNLSMDGTDRKRKEDGLLGSSLYEAPPEANTAAAAAATGSTALASASGSTLASALKRVSESGWSEKAHRGFAAPKLLGGSLSGMGAASGGRSGSSGGTNAFGSSNAQVGFADAHGLSGGGADVEAGLNSKGMGALQAASAQALLAAADRSNDGARGAMSRPFDGAKAGTKIDGGSILSGTYAALDAAPANLKLADPKLMEKKSAAPPAAGVDVGQSDMDDSELAKQIAMQVAAAVLGSVIGGPVGGIVTTVGMQAVQRQMDQEEKVRQLEEQQRLDRAARKMGVKSSSS
ncbi:MAG: hypothetical protein AAB268_13935 [Elusimicrobiota bacterium]